MSDKLERLKSQLDDLEKKYRERKSKTSLQIKRIEEQARKEKRAFRASSLIKIGLFYLDSEAKRYFDAYINGCRSRNEKPTEMKLPLDYRERRIQRYLNDLGGKEEKHLDLAGKMVDFEIAEIENRIGKLIENYNLRMESQKATSQHQPKAVKRTKEEKRQERRAFEKETYGVTKEWFDYITFKEQLHHVKYGKAPREWLEPVPVIPKMSKEEFDSLPENQRYGLLILRKVPLDWYDWNDLNDLG